MWLLTLLFVHLCLQSAKSSSGVPTTTCPNLLTKEKCYFDQDCYWDPRPDVSGPRCRFTEHLVATGCAAFNSNFQRCFNENRCAWFSSTSTCHDLYNFEVLSCDQIRSEESCWKNAECYFDRRIQVNACKPISKHSFTVRSKFARYFFERKKKFFFLVRKILLFYCSKGVFASINGVHEFPEYLEETLLPEA